MKRASSFIHQIRCLLLKSILRSFLMLYFSLSYCTVGIITHKCSFLHKRGLLLLNIHHIEIGCSRVVISGVMHRILERYIMPVLFLNWLPFVHCWHESRRWLLHHHIQCMLGFIHIVERWHHVLSLEICCFIALGWSHLVMARILMDFNWT